jgi:hypothetical protein
MRSGHSLPPRRDKEAMQPSARRAWRFRRPPALLLHSPRKERRETEVARFRFGLNGAVSRELQCHRETSPKERQRERRAGLERLVLDRLEAGVRAGACSDPSRSRGIDNTASPVEAAAVDQRRNACPVGERKVGSVRHDG